jgi:hypothetical protein
MLQLVWSLTECSIIHLFPNRLAILAEAFVRRDWSEWRWLYVIRWILNIYLQTTIPSVISYSRKWFEYCSNCSRWMEVKYRWTIPTWEIGEQSLVCIVDNQLIFNSRCLVPRIGCFWNYKATWRIHCNWARCRAMVGIMVWQGISSQQGESHESYESFIWWASSRGRNLCRWNFMWLATKYHGWIKMVPSYVHITYNRS